MKLKLSYCRFKLLVASALIALLALANSATAQSRHDVIPHGPKIGTAMAAALAGAVDQTGKRHSFESLRGKNGLILLFSRSFDW